MDPDTVVGWDIGGAHVKAAVLGHDGVPRRALQLPCPLWQGLDQLDATLDALPAFVRQAGRHAVTMTAEMVDLFPSRRDGVLRLAGRLGARWRGAELLFYAGRRGFVPPEAAAAAAESIASANWLATAHYAASRIPAGLLVDIGSTTTDIIAIADHEVASVSETDADRQASGELVYTGVVRTPLMAVADRAPLRGRWVGLAAEYFATTADVYRILGLLDEAADQQPSADGSEKTPAGSRRRLARMVGRDAESGSEAEWRALAEWLAEAQLRRIEDGIALVLSRRLLPADAPIIAAGAGRFLARRLALRLARPRIEFSQLLPGQEGGTDWLDTCAPAVAVACLAQAA